ncbi:MAG TPA: gamma-glutamylcyclotransferase family protein [Gammaproteobacteria bacterium]|nr:gamma-glutamylcyclotransferase family protein [Gammaproteobacteria bacterium]
MSTSLVRIFVYGSLRRDGSAHRLLRGAVCLGRWRTPPCYTLLSLGDWPAAVMGGRTAIAGEVYAVSHRILAVLDAYEGVPGLYRRLTIATPWGEAWMYVLARPVRAPRAASGDWFAQGRRS